MDKRTKDVAWWVPFAVILMSAAAGYALAFGLRLP